MTDLFQPQGSATRWLDEGGIAQVLRALRTGPSGAVDLPYLWEAFGWRHSPPKEENDAASSQSAEADTDVGLVLSQLVELNDQTLAIAIQGLTFWFMKWEEQLAKEPLAPRVWHRLWPQAVLAANVRSPEEANDSDLLNTPVGRLCSAFMRFTVRSAGTSPNDDEDDLAQMRSTILDSTGLARLVGLAHMVRCLDWFLQADPEWSEEHLVDPLRKDDPGAVFLWECLGPERLSSTALRILGDEMLNRVHDERIRRDARKQILSALVLDALRAFYFNREPVIPGSRLQQMIRRLQEDEMRGHCAFVLWRCLKTTEESPEAVFCRAVRPFLQDIWPLDRSLRSLSVGRWMAAIPPAARGQLVAAVDSVLRFVTPVPGHTLVEYDLYGDEKLDLIDSEDKAAAILRLMERTAGDGENARTPLRMSSLLARVRKVAPRLVESRRYARLASLPEF